MSAYTINPSVEVTPAGGDRYELRTPLLGGHVTADLYESNLLQQFAGPSTIDDMLERFPRHVERTRAFLEQCVKEHLLLSVDETGEAKLPDRAPVSTRFAGVPAFDPEAPAAFTVLGVPFDAHTTGLAGAKFGPASIRGAAEGIRYQLNPHSLQPRGFHDYATGTTLLRGIALADAGDVVVPPGERAEDTFERVTRAVAELIDAGTLPFVMGGDHSVTYAILRAFPVERLGIVHIDAHTDLGGAYVDAGLHHGNVFTFVLDRIESVAHITQIGLRGLVDAMDHEPTEKVHQLGVDIFRTQGIEAVIDALPEDLPYYVSLDIDAVDPAFAPSTGTPVPNGLHPHELKTLLHTLGTKRRIIGMDVMEVAQADSAADGTAGLAVEAMLFLADGTVKGTQHFLSVSDDYTR